jgi:zinc transport system substrate-binding protein
MGKGLLPQRLWRPLREQNQGDSTVKKMFISGLLILFLSMAQIVFARPLKVFVSILPQKYFIEKIGGDFVEVAVMVQPGASPATYEPKPKQMVALAKSDAYFAIGVPFEKMWLPKIVSTNPKIHIIYTQAGIEKRLMKSHHPHQQEAKYHYGETERGQDHHTGKDPHVWLSPPLVMQQARNILNGLETLNPTHRALYQANYKSFIVELVDLDFELKRLFQTTAEHSEFMVFHPSWGYFAHAYGLEQVPIEIEGKEPKPAEMKYLIQYGKKIGIQAIFVQPQFSWQAAQTIAQATNAHIVIVDPLAPNWSENLRQVAVKLSTALR